MRLRQGHDGEVENHDRTKDRALSHSAAPLIRARDLMIFGSGMPRSFAKCVAIKVVMYGCDFIALIAIFKPALASEALA